MMIENEKIEKLGINLELFFHDNFIPVEQFALIFESFSQSQETVTLQWTPVSEKITNFDMFLNNEIYFGDLCVLLLTFFSQLHIDAKFINLIIEMPSKAFNSYIKKYPKELVSRDTIIKNFRRKGIILCFIIECKYK